MEWMGRFWNQKRRIGYQIVSHLQLLTFYWCSLNGMYSMHECVIVIVFVNVFDEAFSFYYLFNNRLSHQTEHKKQYSNFKRVKMSEYLLAFGIGSNSKLCTLPVLIWQPNVFGCVLNSICSCFIVVSSHLDNFQHGLQFSFVQLRFNSLKYSNLLPKNTPK